MFKIDNRNLKIACIVDNFSYECLKYESDIILINTWDYEKVIQSQNPDLLLVESAWEGNNGQWTGMIIKNHYLIKKLTNLCKKIGIPTVFWSKEDPINFKYFIKAAALFDYIFTTDSDSIQNYKIKCKNDKVFTLPHAAQIKIHNPIDKDKEKIGRVAFAGAWYGNTFPQRSEDMNIILKAAFEYKIDIYDRNYNKSCNSQFRYPKEYLPYVKPGLRYNEMIKAYKKYDVLLNVNTVRDSPTMNSMRVFEILACGVNLVSTYSKSLKIMLEDIVHIVNNESETKKCLDVLLNNKDYRDKLSIKGQREVFNNHTYTHRVRTILDKVNIGYDKYYNVGVSIIGYIDCIDNLNKVIDNYLRQGYNEKELIVVYDNIDFYKKADLNKFRLYTDIKFIYINDFDVNCISYNYISKFYYLNYYAKDFIGDLMNAFDYTNADIVGKKTYYMHLEDNKISVINNNMENRYTDILYSDCSIIKKDIFNKLLFKDIVNFCKKQNYRIYDNKIKMYSTDRFNFLKLSKIISEAKYIESISV